MSAQDRIRVAAKEAGWSQTARAGERHNYGRGGIYDADVFRIGRCDRHLDDGTPVKEVEHEIWVQYRRDGQVRIAGGVHFTVKKVIYQRGIQSLRSEKNKEARVIAALASHTSKIKE